MGIRPAYHNVLEVITDMLAQFRMISGDRKGVVKALSSAFGIEKRMQVGIS